VWIEEEGVNTFGSSAVWKVKRVSRGVSYAN
jgi:hypothetical protein